MRGQGPAPPRPPKALEHTRARLNLLHMSLLLVLLVIINKVKMASKKAFA